MENRSIIYDYIRRLCSILQMFVAFTHSAPADVFPHPKIAGQSKSQEALFPKQGRIQQKVDSAAVL